MEKHDVDVVEIIEKNEFKNVDIEYTAAYYYCSLEDAYYSDEELKSNNDISMKNAYRKKMGLLTTKEICETRSKYGISQSDLCILLGWGAKTITRYEGHQVQDKAHDTILRKISTDPEWFLSLLERAKGSLSSGSYEKYREAANSRYEEKRDDYLRKTIMARYVRYLGNTIVTGNKMLYLDKVVDVVRYFANATEVINLYKVKLMKMLWYADALSYKRRGHSITGLVYQALPMGAVPIAHDLIIDLMGICYDEVDMGESTAYRFKSTSSKEYRAISTEDMSILNDIIKKFGKYSKDEIVQTMHRELAYIETAPRDIIQYKYAKDLSIS